MKIRWFRLAFPAIAFALPGAMCVWTYTMIGSTGSAYTMSGSHVWTAGVLFGSVAAIAYMAGRSEGWISAVADLLLEIRDRRQSGGDAA